MLRKSKLLLFLALALVYLLSSCTTPAPNPLPEIRDYQGQGLSSVNDFQENSIKGPQRVNIDEYRLKISGLVSSPQEYTYDQVKNNHQNIKKLARLLCVEGWGVTLLWEGVLIKDLLAEAGVLPEAKTVIFHSHDGYSTSLPIEYFTNNEIIMAFRMNEIDIPPERGYPFMLVAEKKWGYKWAKWITEIELSDNVDYRGYWESRGYNNNADYPGNFFENPFGS